MWPFPRGAPQNAGVKNRRILGRVRRFRLRRCPRRISSLGYSLKTLARQLGLAQPGPDRMRKLETQRPLSGVVIFKAYGDGGSLDGGRGSPGDLRYGRVELRIFRLGLLQGEKIRVGIFPEGKKIFVGGERASAGGNGIRSLQGFRPQGIGASYAQMR